VKRVEATWRVFISMLKRYAIDSSRARACRITAHLSSLLGMLLELCTANGSSSWGGVSILPILEEGIVEIHFDIIPGTVATGE